MQNTVVEGAEGIGSPASLDIFRSPLLEGIPHGFLGRGGGFSEGQVAGLNVGLGAGDDPQAVARNRATAAHAIVPGGHLASVYQIHSADCVALPKGQAFWPETDRPHADALVTNQTGVVLGIVTADCAPVLFADRKAGVVGAAHAGWKGAISGVTDATIAAMETLGASRDSIVAVVGPCIAQASYEVDDAFRDRFLAQSPESEECFILGRSGHHMFDLEGYVLARLRKAGVTEVQGLHMDTYADAAHFYSFRRATHLSEASYGRQMSLIALG